MRKLSQIRDLKHVTNYINSRTLWYCVNIIVYKLYICKSYNHVDSVNNKHDTRGLHCVDLSLRKG